jgi:hypothetical protein
MSLRKIIIISYENQTKHINTLRAKNAVNLEVKANGKHTSIPTTSLKKGQASR